jgi:exopolyphosphatase / guanosine-5'-triphosphate,3'-diphosphate pyrophosphatase
VSVRLSRKRMTRAPASNVELVAVLDMGASAIRLVIAEITLAGDIRVIEEASRGVLLGRDTFSNGVIRAQTVDAALAALEGFRDLMQQYGVAKVRAVATSAVREARNGDMFLDRISGRTGISFEIINEAEESRLVYLAVRQTLGRHPAFRGFRTLLVEVSGGSTSLTLMRRGHPNRSGVYGLGAVRMRQQLNLGRHSQDLQTALLKRHVTNVIEEIRLDLPLSRVAHFIAVGGDIRFAAAHILEQDRETAVREIPREAFLAFCDQIESLDEERLVDRFRLPAVEAETLVPALLVYRALLAASTAATVVVCDASLRGGLLLDLGKAGGPLGAEDFEAQVLASAEAVGEKYRFDRAHGRHVAKLANRLFEDLQDEHALSSREGLLLQVAALLHDIGVYVGLRAHHKHSQYLLAGSQIFGLSNDETAVVSNIARYHRRGAPQKSHLPYIALDSHDRLVVSKLASILRVANALDAEHLQKVHDVRLVRQDKVWTLEIDGAGDLTMELMAASARADMFAETFGRQLVLRRAGVVT